MKNSFETKLATLSRKRHAKQSLSAIVGIVAIVSVFFTAYALILPAITMTGGPNCGLEEHTHTESCYETISIPKHDELICTLEEHTHSDNCYNASGELICDIAEHVHSDECFEHIDAHEEIILRCEKAEHQHSEECYPENRENSSSKETNADVDAKETLPPEALLENSEQPDIEATEAPEKEDGPGSARESFRDVTVNLTLNKRNRVNNKRLSGAAFDIYRPANSGETGVELDGVSGRYVKVNGASAITDSNGCVTFSDLPIGTYYLVETAAPDGFILNRTPHRIELTETAAICSDDDSYISGSTGAGTGWRPAEGLVVGETYLITNNTSHALNSNDGVQYNATPVNISNNMVVGSIPDSIKWVAVNRNGSICLRNVQSGEYIWLRGHLSYYTGVNNIQDATALTYSGGKLYGGSYRFVWIDYWTCFVSVSSSSSEGTDVTLYSYSNTVDLECTVFNVPEPSSLDPDASISKYVEKLDGDDYNLHLTLNGNNFFTSDTGKLDLLFIIDTTGSMMDSMEGYQNHSNERWNAIVRSVNSLLGYVDANDIDVEYSMISFASGYTDFNDAKLEFSWTPNASAVTQRLDYLGNWLGGGTNYEAPFYELQHDTLLADSRPDAKTVILFISDGEPNAYYDAYGSPVHDGDGNIALERAINRLSVLQGIDGFCAIGVSNDTELSTLNALANAAPCSWKCAYQCNSSDELNSQLLQIIEELTLNSISNVTVVDTFSEYAQITEDSTLILTVMDGNGNTICSAESECLYGSTSAVSVNGVLPATELNDQSELVLRYDPETRQIILDFPNDYMLENGYTYMITVKIEPTPFAYSEYESHGYNSIGDHYTGETSSGQSGFRSNTEATVTYDIPRDSGITEYYPHPVIQVAESFELPITGGIGQLPFYISGSIITASVGFLLFKRKKNKKGGS